ncbi:hypothetical protein VPH35_025902 [Triticum aestivum]|uniref:Uncharacterized protein n=1 Tax=Triticum turgidum subsp. durum TaxID=4567 RepID=A0A9R1RGJ4_TRITD|nr:unnamed protein product [Triticum turgidum subsp. durum]
MSPTTCGTRTLGAAAAACSARSATPWRRHRLLHRPGRAGPLRGARQASVRIQPVLPRRAGVRLTATPRCVYPDWYVQRALDTGLFERIHVRFYGEDRCSYSHVHKDGVMAQWSKWTARYPRSKVYIGLPAANVPGTGRNDEVGLMSMNYDLMR